MKNLILNLSVSKELKDSEIKNSRIELNGKQTSEILSGNYYIGKCINLQDLKLDSSHDYKITGGSTISGTPARKYVNSFNPIKEFVNNRKHKLRVFSKYIDTTWAVIDIKIIPK